MSTSRTFFTLLVVAALCTSVQAQSSRMLDAVSRIRNFGQTLEDNVNRTPLDEAKIYDTARRIQEAARSAADLFNVFGEPLAAAASSPFEQQLREPSRLSKRIAYLLSGEMVPKCDVVMKLINTDPRNRDSDFLSSVRLQITGLMVQTVDLPKTVAEQQKNSEETRRWLRERFQTFLAIRDDFAKTATTLDEAKRRLEESCRSQAMVVDKATKDWMAAHLRELEASRRYYDAFAEYNSARNASPGSSYASTMKSAWEKWSTMQRAHREAGKIVHECLTNLENATREARARLVELARLMSELEKFQESASPETVSRRIVEFEQWIKLFDQDMNR